MKHYVSKMLGAVFLTSALVLTGCGEGKLPKIKETRYFNGHVLLTYQDKTGNNEIDEVKVDFIGSFPVGAMSYVRDPTIRELGDSKKILALEKILLEY